MITDYMFFFADTCDTNSDDESDHADVFEPFEPVHQGAKLEGNIHELVHIHHYASIFPVCNENSTCLSHR